MGGFAVGSGLVSIACPQDVYAVIAASCLEAMVHPYDHVSWRGADAVVAGPGWGTRADLEAVLDAGMPLVLDADGLNMLAEDADMIVRLKARQAPTVITPHPGEAARLLGTDTATVQGNRLAAALQLAERFGCWVVLKGADSLVVSPQRELWLCPYGSPRLAVAGTGDVLAGMIGGLLAQGRALEVAVPAAVALHALAGESGGWHLAGELSARIVAIIERGVF
jgi:NAD(P)H-hydrate epimerase